MLRYTNTVRHTRWCRRVSIGALHQRTQRKCAIRDIEVMKRRELAARCNHKHRATSAVLAHSLSVATEAGAAAVSCSIEVSIRSFHERSWIDAVGDIERSYGY